MILMTPKKICAMASTACDTRSPSGPMREMAKPVRIDTSRTCNRSPPENALTKVFGMMFIRWVVTPSWPARDT
jgi:hypothetical protein